HPVLVNRAPHETLDESLEKRSNLYSPCMNVLLTNTGEMFHAKPETNDLGHEPAGPAFLPLARAWHPVLRLRHSQMDDPLASWLYPVFLLRFVRTQPLLRGVLLVFLATVLVLALELPGFFPLAG